MDQKETGKLIAKLRREAGYTQQSLANALYVTDKAVSKWERGICMPDSSLLTKLSMLLDVDIEHLISGITPYGEHDWVGEIRVNDIEGDIAGKPLVHYLLSYFMLIGITDVAIITDKIDYIKKLDLEKFGLNISFLHQKNEKTLILYDKVLLFGLSLTRSFQNYLHCEKGVRLELDGKTVPLLFSHHADFSDEWHRENCELKILGRGMIMLPLNTPGQIADASCFVEIYEKNHGKKIADLAEIAQVRRLV